MAVQIIGRKVEANPNEILIDKDDGVYAYPKKVFAFQTSVKINPSDYALIQEGNEANTAISMAQRFNGKNLNFYEMIEESRKTGEILATPRRFMKNLLDANNARAGKEVVYDALGNLIEGDKLIQYTDMLNRDHWVYLNGRFPKGRGFKDLDFVTINTDGSLTRVALEDCLEQDGYAELELNSQGFPTKRAKTQNYEAGKTIYFFSPVLRLDNPDEGYVARALACSVGAGLYCDSRLDIADPSLGGFVCAEGAVKIK